MLQQPTRHMIMRKTLLLLLFIVLFTAGCTSFFFYPRKELIDNPVARRFSPEDVYFKTSDGLTLHGWFFKARDARGTVLVLHGNAENISTHASGVLWLVPEGFNVFIFDYRGYGRSEGRPTVAGVHKDADAALETLFSMEGVNKDRIVVLGQSLGGAVAVYTLANSPHKSRIKALVIESAFSSYRRIAREKTGQVCCTWPFQYPLSFTVNDRYSPVRWIGKISPTPVLILHGEQDPVVPLHHGRILFDAALPPREFWETATPGHIRSFAGEAVRQRLAAYLSMALSMP